MTKSYKLGLTFLAAVLAFALWTVPAGAFPVNITDSNSSLLYNTTFGATAWTVDGTNNLFYESWFVRIGNGPALELGSAALGGSFNTGPDPINPTNKWGTTYNLGAYGTVRLTHTLIGGAPGSHHSQWITSFDFTAIDSQPIAFYAYADVDLGGSTYSAGNKVVAADDRAEYWGNGQFVQYDDIWRLSWDATLDPDHYTIRGFNNVGGVPAEAAGNLNDMGSSFYGDPIFMAQWNNPTDFHVFRTIVPVPEPSTFLLLGGGLAGLALVVRRKRKL